MAVVWVSDLAGALSTDSWAAVVDTTALAVESLFWLSGSCWLARGSSGLGWLLGSSAGSGGWTAGGDESGRWWWWCCSGSGTSGGRSRARSGSGDSWGWVGAAAAGTGEWSWSRDGVSTATVVWLTTVSVDAHLNSWVILRIGTWEGNRGAGSGASTAGDVDLNARDL